MLSVKCFYKVILQSYFTKLFYKVILQSYRKYTINKINYVFFFKVFIVIC